MRESVCERPRGGRNLEGRWELRAVRLHKQECKEGAAPHIRPTWGIACYSSTITSTSDVPSSNTSGTRPDGHVERLLGAPSSHPRRRRPSSPG